MQRFSGGWNRRRLGELLSVIVFLLMILSCDHVVPTADGIAQDQDLQVFHIGLVKIIPLDLDVDSNRLEYEYETTYSDADSFFSSMDQESGKKGWKTEEGTMKKRVYSKRMKFNAIYQERVVDITFTPESSRVKVISTVRLADVQ